LHLLFLVKNHINKNNGNLVFSILGVSEITHLNPTPNMWLPSFSYQKSMSLFSSPDRIRSGSLFGSHKNFFFDMRSEKFYLSSKKKLDIPYKILIVEDQMGRGKTSDFKYPAAIRNTIDNVTNVTLCSTFKSATDVELTPDYRLFFLDFHLDKHHNSTPILIKIIETYAFSKDPIMIICNTIGDSLYSQIGTFCNKWLFQKTKFNEIQSRMRQNTIYMKYHNIEIFHCTKLKNRGLEFIENGRCYPQITPTIPGSKDVKINTINLKDFLWQIGEKRTFFDMFYVKVNGQNTLYPHSNSDMFIDFDEDNLAHRNDAPSKLKSWFFRKIIQIGMSKIWRIRNSQDFLDDKELMNDQTLSLLKTAPRLIHYDSQHSIHVS